MILAETSLLVRLMPVYFGDFVFFFHFRRRTLDPGVVVNFLFLKML